MKAIEKTYDEFIVHIENSWLLQKQKWGTLLKDFLSYVNKLETLNGSLIYDYLR